MNQEVRMWYPGGADKVTEEAWTTQRPVKVPDGWRVVGTIEATIGIVLVLVRDMDGQEA